MNQLTIYHGSINIIKKPIFGYGKAYNDYGLGFYTTESLSLAKEWACSEKTDGYANQYTIDISNLKILNLTSDDYNILNWLAILIKNRKVNLSTPISKKGEEYLISYFLPNYEDYDIIIGYRADDSYFSFARAFLMNEISLKQLSYAMNLGHLGEQVVLKSKKAFDLIKFVNFELAENVEYYPKKIKRNEEAKKAFEENLQNDDINGIFMRDILREKIKNDDPRLR